MASTTDTASISAESPVSRKRPAEEEASRTPAKDETDASAPNAANGEKEEEEEQTIKRARTEDAAAEGDEKKESEGGEKENGEGEETGKKEEGSEAPKLNFLPSVGEGFSSFSKFAPLSFSSVSSSTDTAPLTFNVSGSEPTFKIDFSSPTPFGSFFGAGASKDGAGPVLTSTGFSLFSSSSPSSSSSDFAFSLGSSSSSLLFSSGADTSSTSVAEKVELVTGEESEERVHSVRAKLFKLEQETQSWKERGAGQLHLNIAKDRSYARLVMRAEGALRLILNAALFPHTVVKRVQEKGVQVSAVEEGKPVLYLLRVARRDEAEQLFDAINERKTTAGSVEKEEAK